MKRDRGRPGKLTREVLARTLVHKKTGEAIKCGCGFRWRVVRGRDGMPAKRGPFLSSLKEGCRVHFPQGPGTPARSLCCGAQLHAQAMEGRDWETFYCAACGRTQETPGKMIGKAQ